MAAEKGRGTAAAALALSLLLTASASGGSSHAAEPASRPDPARLVLATFASVHPDFWQPAVRDLAERLGVRPVYAWPMESLAEECVVFEVPPGRGEPDRVVEQLRANGRVTLAAPVRRYHTTASPWNDAYADLQPGLAELGIASAQKFSTGRGVRVAVVDTGIDVAHPDLEGRIVLARNFVLDGEESFTRDAHGTAIAGVVAADANNRVGIVGVAPEAELLALKACWPDPPGSRLSTCDSYTLARALDFAIGAGTRVLNLSLAGPEDPLLARLLDRAEATGTMVVSAVDESGDAPFPASLDTVLAARAESVEGGGDTGARPGPTVPAGAIEAPGVGILTTGPQGSYDFYSGSSLAAAHVSGVAALVLERRPDLTPAALRDLLRRASSAPPGGVPRLSACAAVGLALGQAVCPPPAADGGPVSP
jgi:subtilisin family serine protease